MAPGLVALWVIVAYLALLVALGLWSSRASQGSAADYFLAGRSIGPFLLLMSVFGTTMTAFALVGSTGESFSRGIGVYGLMASMSAIIHSAVFFFVGMRLWAFGKKHGYMTQIQFFRDRLESEHIGLCLFPILVGLLIPYLLIGVMAAGTIVNVVTENAFPSAFEAYDGGVPPALGSAVVCLVVLAYVFCGGLRGAARANALQTIVFMVVALVAFVLIADKLGGFRAASEGVVERNPSRFMRSVGAVDIAAYEARHARWAAAAETAYAAANGLPADGLDVQQQHAAHEAFRQRQRDPEYESAACAMFAKPLANPDPTKRWTRRKAVGVYKSKYWEPVKPHGIGLWEFLTYMFIPLSVGMFPHLFQHWLTARSARAFRLSIIAHPLCIMLVWTPCVLIGAWATSALIADGPRAGQALVSPFINPNAVLVYLVKVLTTPFVGGLLSAGILAAIMSSLDSQFLCLGNIFTNDIFLHYRRGRSYSEPRKAVIGRLFVVAVVVVTYVLSLANPRSVFTLGIWCFSGFGALFPVVFCAVYWPRLTRAGAYAGIIGTAAAWLWLFRDAGYGSTRHYLIDWLGEGRGIMPVTVLFAICLLLTVGVSLATRPPSDACLDKFFPSRG